MWGIMERQNWTASALEQAARQGQKIVGQDLSGLNLRDADLDGLHLDHCNLSGADLRGCNLSDAMIRKCDLSYIEALDICLADSVLEQCDFSYARFGGSTVVRARFMSCRFAGPTALMLEWDSTAQMDHLSYSDINGVALPFNEPPLVVQAPGLQLVWCQDQLLINNSIYRGEDHMAPDLMRLHRSLQTLRHRHTQG